MNKPSSMKTKIGLISALLLAPLAALHAEDAPKRSPRAPDRIVHSIVPHVGLTDPHIHMFNGVAYLFAGHDDVAGYNGRTWDMRDWWVWRSEDLVDWTKVYTLRPEDTWMGRNNCFATDAAERNGKYYWYLSQHTKAIGVVVADRPEGPYRDVLGKPLVPVGLTPTQQYDPTVFIDDDPAKTPYLVFGEAWKAGYYICRLNDDMVSLAEAPRRLEITGKYHGEDKNFLFKHNGIYYLEWGGTYAVSRSVYGPYVVQTRGYVSAAHSSVFQRRSQWFIAHEESRTPGGGGWFHRGAAIHYLHFATDGSIFVDEDGGYGVGEYDAGRPELRFANYMEATGIEKTGLGNLDSFVVNPSGDGAMLCFPKVYGLKENALLTFSAAAPAPGWTIELHEGGAAGPLLGRREIPAGGAEFQSLQMPLVNHAGTRDLCFVFRGRGGPAPAFKSFTFNPGGADWVTPHLCWDFVDSAQGWTAFTNGPVQWMPHALQIKAGETRGVKSPLTFKSHGNLTANKVVRLRLKNRTAATRGVLRFSTVPPKTSWQKVQESWPEENRLEFAIAAHSDAFQEYTLDLSAVPGWMGQLNQLRIELTAAGTEGDWLLSDVEIWNSSDFPKRDSYRGFKP